MNNADALSPDEEKIRQDAIAFAKSNKKFIARRLTNRDIYIAEDNPVSVFMAGSPGAGKTEASIELLEQLEGPAAIRIDPDELRSEFAAYCGSNSWLFQPAISILVEKIIDFAFDQKQSFLLDGTLSNIAVARRNIKRSIAKNRATQILYVYQEPGLAWAFVQKREKLEGRNIPLEQFIEQYFQARTAVNTLKEEFGAALKVDLLLKNNDGSNRVYKANIDRIDNHVPEKYNRTDLERVLRGPI